MGVNVEVDALPVRIPFGNVDQHIRRTLLSQDPADYLVALPNRASKLPEFLRLVENLQVQDTWDGPASAIGPTNAWNLHKNDSAPAIQQAAVKGSAQRSPVLSARVKGFLICASRVQV